MKILIVGRMKDRCRAVYCVSVFDRVRRLQRSVGPSGGAAPAAVSSASSVGDLCFTPRRHRPRPQTTHCPLITFVEPGPLAKKA